MRALPNLIFSLFSDKGRKTDSCIRRRNTVQPGRQDLNQGEIALIFLVNILCVHVRKSDVLYACKKKKKKKNETEVTVHMSLAFDFAQRSLHRTGATHVLTVYSCQKGSSHKFAFL